MENIEKVKSSLQRFIGTKEIKACPMNWGKYCTLRGWEVKEDRDPKESGYLVEYHNDSASNVEGFEGYISWSPAKPFDEAYRIAENNYHLIRIKIKNTQEEIDRLEKYLEKNKEYFKVFSVRDKLVRIQLQILKVYLQALDDEHSEILRISYIEPNTTY